MHYRNGREAKPGDHVVFLQPYGGPPLIGLLHSLQSQSDTCNGRLAIATANDPYVNLKDCVHIEDVAGAFPVPKNPESPPIAAEPQAH